MLRAPSPTQIPCRGVTASPTSTAVSLTYVNVAKLPSAFDLGCASSTILQNRPAVTNALYADAVRQDVACHYGLSPSPSPSPPPLLLGAPQAGLDVIELLHQPNNSVLVKVAMPVNSPSHLHVPSKFCQVIQPAVTHATTAVNSDSSSPGASRSSTSPALPSRKLKDDKKLFRTTMCRNGPNCIWHKKNHCDYAHSPEELRCFTLFELLASKDKDYLSHACFDYTMTGYW